MAIRRRVAQVQGLYYAATGLWALFDLDSFELITGPKTDDWLVKTVAVLVLAIGLSLIVAARRAPTVESGVLGAGSALGLLAIELFYVLRETISPIYLADAVLEALFLAGWSLPRRRGLRVGVIRRAAPHWLRTETR